jgi:hypothetical protein
MKWWHYLLVVTILLPFAACIYWIYPKAVVHYHIRTVVELDTPYGARSGESVISVLVAESPDMQGGRGQDSTVKGNAIIIDVGSGLYAVALMARGQDGDSVFGVMHAQVILQQRSPWDGIRELQKRGGALTGKATLAAADMPPVIIMSDLSDPRAFEPLLPGQEMDGVRIRSVMIEAVSTRTPVTTGIEKKIPWIATEQERILCRP